MSSSSKQLEQLAMLWGQAEPSVSTFLAASVACFQDAEDILQDVAVDVARNFSKYDTSRPFSPWAMAIARYKVVDYYRKQGKSGQLLSSQAIDALEGASVRISGRHSDDHDILEQCLKTLTERGRHILRLRYANDLKPREIACTLGETLGTVSKILYRARRTLEECMNRRMGKEPQQ